MSFKSVLVTGGSGQLGTCLQKLIEQSPVEHFEFIFKSYSDFDITDSNLVSAVLKEGNFAYCVNCAAYTHVDMAETEPSKTEAINVDGVRNLALGCKENGTTLIHISTDFVFDGEAKNPYSETDKTNPLGVYGLTKRKGENVIREIHDKHFIIRTSWLYSEIGDNFMKTMLRLANEKDELSVVNDQMGSPTYGMDLAGFILEILKSQSKRYGMYHYSNQGETSWYDFAKTIFELADISIKLNPITSNAYPSAAKRPKYSVLNSSKAKNTFGIEIPYWTESLAIALKTML